MFCLIRFVMSEHLVVMLQLDLGVTFRFLFSTAKQEVPCPKDGEWIKFNDDNKGFFRSNYDQKNWKLLGEQLKNKHEVRNSFRLQLLFVMKSKLCCCSLDVC